MLTKVKREKEFDFVELLHVRETSRRLRSKWTPAEKAERKAMARKLQLDLVSLMGLDDLINKPSRKAK